MRGVVVNAGRNFLSTAVIKKLIVGMAMLKMNVLHWHMADDQSFPVSTRAFPQLAQKTTFGPTAHYNSNDCPCFFSSSLSRVISRWHVSSLIFCALRALTVREIVSFAAVRLRGFVHIPAQDAI